MMYDELIEALRYCISDEFLKRGCCKCPINKDGMMCGTQDDAIKYAADAIEELRKNWEFTSDLLNLAIRMGAKSMSALMAVYEAERKDGEHGTETV